MIQKVCNLIKKVCPYKRKLSLSDIGVGLDACFLKKENVCFFPPYTPFLHIGCNAEVFPKTTLTLRDAEEQTNKFLVVGRSLCQLQYTSSKKKSEKVE